MVEHGWITPRQIGCVSGGMEAVYWEVSCDDRVEVSEMTERGCIGGGCQIY